MSCSPRIVEHTRIDSRDRFVRDSLYIHDSVFVKEKVKGDTVFLDRFVYRYIYKDKVRTDTVLREVRDTTLLEVKIEKPLSAWQSFKIRGFRYLFAALIAALLWIFRKPLIKLIKP